MTDAERKFFRTIAERDPPKRRVKELWVIGGRRGGKDSVTSAIVAYLAGMFTDRDKRLSPGERASVLCLAVDRDQAGVVLGYVKSYFNDLAMLKKMVASEMQHGLELKNCVEGQQYERRGRGLCAILDECAFWKDESSANPDQKVYEAVKPALATMSEAMIIGICTPHAKSGLLFKKYQKHYGKNDDAVLVIKAPTTVLNPMIPQSVVDEALELNPSEARAEYLAEFREDIEQFVSHEVMERAVIAGRVELPRIDGVVYKAFVDPAGGGEGGGANLMVLTFVHAEGDRWVQDLIREWRPPFSPAEVVKEACALMTAYGISEVYGDNWGGEWAKEPFVKNGKTYIRSPKVKNDIYRDIVAHLNSGRIELLDHAKQTAQFLQLERRVQRGGRDVINHPTGLHDDLCNAASGALLLLAAPVAQRIPMTGPYVVAESGVIADPSWNRGIDPKDPDFVAKERARKANEKFQAESQQIAAKSTSGRGGYYNPNDDMSFAAIGGRTKRINWR